VGVRGVSALVPADGARLLAIAQASLAHGLRHGSALPLDAAAESPPLRALGASFVTLRTVGRELRGCIGTLEPVRPVAADVAENAYGAAFRDPRFPPLGPREAGALQLSVSLLGAPVRLAAASEAELLAQLQPGRDGLILALGARRATFLPEVWDALPAPAEFLEALKRKAGLPPGFWSDRIETFRYETLSIHGAASS
jgi:AmmeMemoRadiSam system protein A